MSINNIFFTHRIIGGGFFFRRNKSNKNALRENTSYSDILKIALDQLIFWENLLKKENVRLALNLPNHAYFS